MRENTNRIRSRFISPFPITRFRVILRIALVLLLFLSESVSAELRSDIAAAISDDGREAFIAIGGEYPVAARIDTSTGDVLRTCTPTRSQPTAVAVSRAREEAAFAWEGGIVQVWSLSTGTPVRELRTRRGNVTALKYSDRSDCMGALVEGSYPVVWDFRASGRSHSMPVVSEQPRLLDFGYGQFSVYFVYTDGVVEEYEWNTGVRLSRSSDLQWLPTAIGYAPNPDSYVGLGDQAGNFYLVNQNNGTLMRHFDAAVTQITAIAMGERDLLAAVGAIDGGISLWDLRTRVRLGDLPGHLQPIVALSFDQESETLMSLSNGGTLKIWDVRGRFETSSFQLDFP